MMTDEADLAKARAEMAAGQIAARGISDPRVLRAMQQVPRHLFVAEGDRWHAYEDRALGIGEGQTISQPYMVAVMTAELAPGSDEKILEIGTGSGYQAAILSELAREVISIERHPALADRARRTLQRLGFHNVRVIVGDGSAGYRSEQPYDGILVTAAAPRVPDVLLTQLAEGGRLVIPVGAPDYQELTVVRRQGGRFDARLCEGCVFVPLIGEFGWGS